MDRGMYKIVIITRKTRLQELVYKYNTVEQAKFYMELRHLMPALHLIIL